jgi:hypothetical protein
LKKKTGERKEIKAVSPKVFEQVTSERQGKSRERKVTRRVKKKNLWSRIFSKK